MIAGTVSSCVVGGLFLFSASAKSFDHRPLQAALTELRFSAPTARLIAVVTPAFELVLAISVILLSAAPVTFALLAIGVVAISIAGILGLISPVSVRCACFSSSSRASLGWRQLGAAGFISAASIVLLIDSEHASLQTRVRLLSTVAIALSTVHLVALLRSIRVAARHRRAVAHVYPA